VTSGMMVSSRCCVSPLGMAGLREVYFAEKAAAVQGSDRRIADTADMASCKRPSYLRCRPILALVIGAAAHAAETAVTAHISPD
jgi:hypothetical protein